MNAAASWRLLAASPCEESESGTRKHGLWIQLHIKERGGVEILPCHLSHFFGWRFVLHCWT